MTYPFAPFSYITVRLRWKEAVDSVEDLTPKLSKAAQLFKKDLNIPEEEIGTARFVISTDEIYIYSEKGWIKLSGASTS